MSILQILERSVPGNGHGIRIRITGGLNQLDESQDRSVGIIPFHKTLAFDGHIHADPIAYQDASISVEDLPPGGRYRFRAVNGVSALRSIIICFHYLQIIQRK